MSKTITPNWTMEIMIFVLFALWSINMGLEINNKIKRAKWLEHNMTTCAEG